MALLHNRDQVTQFLNDTFKDNFDNWICIERHIWRYNAVAGTGTYAHETETNFSIPGQIGRGVNAKSYQDSTLNTLVAEFTKTTSSGVMTHKVYKEGTNYRLITFWTFLYNAFLNSMDKMRGNASYIKAVEMSGKDNPTDQEIATVMATITYTAESEINDSEVKEPSLNVTIEPVEGRIMIKGEFTKDGVPSSAKWSWFIDPLEKLPGLDSHPKAGSVYVGKREFSLSTDFRERDSFTIMCSEQIRIRCFCQYTEENGNPKQMVYDQVHDFSEHLISYDYFGLAES